VLLPIPQLKENRIESKRNETRICEKLAGERAKAERPINPAAWGEKRRQRESEREGKAVRGCPAASVDRPGAAGR
jgi:hypothetical protein